MRWQATVFYFYKEKFAPPLFKKKIIAIFFCNTQCYGKCKYSSPVVKSFKKYLPAQIPRYIHKKRYPDILLHNEENDVLNTIIIS